MAGERRLNWGADATDAKWRSEHDTANSRFVVAEDLDGGTVVLEIDETAGEVVSRYPVNLSGNDLVDGATTVYDASTDTVGDGTTNADHASVNTDDLDIGGSDLAAAGDFVSVGVSASLAEDNRASTTSTSYTGSGLILTTQWDNWQPAGSQTAVIGCVRVLTNDADIRLRNIDDGETAFEETGLSAGANNGLGPANYQPATTSTPTRLVLEFRSTSGSETELVAPMVQTGVQL